MISWVIRYYLTNSQLTIFGTFGNRYNDSLELSTKSWISWEPLLKTIRERILNNHVIPIILHVHVI